MKTTNLKNGDELKNEDDLKNEDSLKNEDDLKSEEDLKMKTTSKMKHQVWEHTLSVFAANICNICIIGKYLDKRCESHETLQWLWHLLENFGRFCQVQL